MAATLPGSTPHRYMGFGANGYRYAQPGSEAGCAGVSPVGGTDRLERTSHLTWQAGPAENSPDRTHLRRPRGVLDVGDSAQEFSVGLVRIDVVD